MNERTVAARRISRAQVGVGSTVCLASSFGLHAAPKPEESAEKLSEVVVTGQPSVDTYGTTLQDTPQNVTVVPQQVLTEQAVTTVQDALKNVPGFLGTVQFGPSLSRRPRRT